MKPQGEPARIYTATKFDASIDFTSGIVLTRYGKSETLNKLSSNQCLDDADCKATEECGPKVCLMYCLVNDPFCCGPSTCQPKAPPPPPSCCDPATKPTNGIEGVWCCGDGTFVFGVDKGPPNDAGLHEAGVMWRALR